MRTTGRVMIWVWSLCLASVTCSHDMWLFPEQLTISMGDTLTVHLRAGHELDTEEELPLLKDVTSRFELITPDGSIDLLRELPDRASPALQRKLGFEGLALLIMEHEFRRVELPDKTFSKYLAQEKLEEIKRLRDKRGPRPVERERYARVLKSLVRVGKERDRYRRIGDEDLRSLDGMTSVKALDLYGTQVTDAGLVHLEGLTGLRSLNLGNTRVTDAGLVHLKKLVNLQTLNLNNTRVTDAGLESLRSLTQLKTPILEAEKTRERMPPIEVLSQRISIRLLQNPYLLDPGDDLEVQVSFDGEPLRDKLVWAYNGSKNGLVSKSMARTNEDGVAGFTLDRKGFWLIRLVHMRPCTEWPDLDWESYWASYSFELD